MSSILLSVKLKGQLTSPVKHVDSQIITLDLSTPKRSNVISKKIVHTNRIESECYRKLKISEEVVNYMESSECPAWEKPIRWKNMSKKLRVLSHLNRLDEGFGISIEYLN